LSRCTKPAQGPLRLRRPGRFDSPRPGLSPKPGQAGKGKDSALGDRRSSGAHLMVARRHSAQGLALA
jgi:hypothetical protein